MNLSTARSWRRFAARRLDSLRLWRYVVADARRYASLRAPSDAGAHAGQSAAHLEAQLAKDLHRVEKGLALREPRRPFGAGVGERLDALLPAGRAAGLDARVLTESAGARDALRVWNERGRVVEDVSPRAASFAGLEAGLRRRFFASRHSVRDFEPNRPVPPTVVREAVDLARATPSVCNRQAFRVHWYSGSAIAPLLALHNGSHGFAESVPSLGIVTVRTHLFSGAGERNQRWIDGGLFAMTLVWALHSLGVSTCMLNWSRPEADARELRAAAGIPAGEDIVVLIAAGHPRAGHRRARSTRRPLTDMLIEHDT